MTEREDTIEKIERVLKLTHKESITVTIPRLTAERAISMLKYQEAVEPRRIDGKRKHFIKCGNCNCDLMNGYLFCPRCGKEVKWNE
jgi:hypothetical protein